METTKQHCDLCGKEIPFGKPYICIVYNIESMERDHLEQQDYVQVLSSDQILTMCGKCGNKNHAEATEKILKSVFVQKYKQLN